MAKIVIEADKCKGCSLCVTACPNKCIDISTGLNKRGSHPALFKSPDSCTGCGFCYLVCPEACIEVHK